MANERYYYSIMTPYAREIYKRIFEGLKAHAPRIRIELLVTAQVVQEIYVRLLYDNPRFYYVNQRVIRLGGAPGRFTLFPEYLYSPSQVVRIDREVRSVIDRINVKGQTLKHDVFRLEKFLHDSVVKSVAYDYDSLMKEDSFNAHSILGPFLDNKAVCEGIAKAFKVLCNEYGIKCIVVLGKADTAGKFDGDTYHAWNLVKIEGDSYQVDPTWDNLYHEGLQHISYDYFNLTSTEMGRDHQPIGLLPACTSTRLNYFHCTNSFVGDYDALYRIISERIENKSISFKYTLGGRGLRNLPELLSSVGIAADKAMRKRHVRRSFKVLFNESQGVCKLLFDP